MTDPITPPIHVPASSLGEQITTLLRYVVTAVGGYALGRGWIDDDLLQMLIALVTIAVPSALGIYRTWRNQRKLRTVAEMVPNSIAVVDRR
ncbi:hypothetical protein EYB45_08540 [Erythrobacteraceae bacterium CFH 75059]|uniref:Pam3-gp28 family putative phage holin n=1 Tax=Qipengyuania thermophila TaxID=2509361 RepID=UPI00101F4698|nr:hypothetical protein [Qipengyuania thermophila]TCD04284.1 hypothetical protein EYB45_08540 [Erythrobacteraceae bacterium CFH 75059]